MHYLGNTAWVGEISCKTYYFDRFLDFSVMQGNFVFLTNLLIKQISRAFSDATQLPLMKGELPKSHMLVVQVEGMDCDLATIEVNQFQLLSNCHYQHMNPRQFLCIGGRNMQVYHTWQVCRLPVKQNKFLVMYFNCPRLVCLQCIWESDLPQELRTKRIVGQVTCLIVHNELLLKLEYLLGRAWRLVLRFIDKNLKD